MNGRPLARAKASVDIGDDSVLMTLPIDIKNLPLSWSAIFAHVEQVSMIEYPNVAAEPAM